MPFVNSKHMWNIIMQSIYCICLDWRYVWRLGPNLSLWKICFKRAKLFPVEEDSDWNKDLCPIKCWRRYPNWKWSVFFKSVSHYHAYQLLIKLANKLTLLSFWVQNDWWLQRNVVCAAAPPQQVCAYEGTWATQVCTCDALSLVAVTGCCWSWTCPMRMSLCVVT